MLLLSAVHILVSPRASTGLVFQVLGWLRELSGRLGQFGVWASWVASGALSKAFKGIVRPRRSFKTLSHWFRGRGKWKNGSHQTLYDE